VEIVLDVEKRFASGAVVSAALRLPAEGDPVTVLFGPSGAGKTTLLRCLAGLTPPDRGTIRYGEEIWFDAGRGVHLPPQARRLGYLSQEDALFPHLTVAENVRYGLPRRDGAGGDRVREALRLVRLESKESRRPSELSGGERQRVALARALAPHPLLLLLDEPLSALDAPTRETLRAELRPLFAAAGIPTVVVTHDRLEALALGDRIAVLVEGSLRQTGPVPEVFSRPADADVARIVGVETVLPARVVGRAEGLLHLDVSGHRLTAVDTGATVTGDVLACIRAEEVLLERGPAAATSARNRFEARVVSLVNEGPLVRVHLDAGFPLAALVTRSAAAELALEPARTVTASVKAQAVHVVPRASR
jgi:molybdate transport system ATP-binding protein